MIGRYLKLAIDYLLSPAFVMHFLFSNLRLYRRLVGGHWERWHVVNPFVGIDAAYWMRVPKCTDSTGEPPAWDCVGHAQQCEERGRAATPTLRIRCPGCDRNLAYHNEVCVSDEVGDTGIYTYSCPCGLWSDWSLSDIVPHYLGLTKENPWQIQPSQQQPKLQNRSV